MMWRPLSHVVLAIATLPLAAVDLLHAQTCNTSSPPCVGTPSCRRGCLASISITHAATSPCGAIAPVADFNLSATEFANTCALGGGCTVALPPLRFWQYQAYRDANSGCFDRVAASVMANAFLDFGFGAPGHWVLYHGNWENGPEGDGCISATLGELRTVAEISFPETAREGSLDHGSLYLVASVPLSADYDFDLVRGGSGCAPGVIATAPVAGLDIVGASSPCIGSTVATTGTLNTLDPLGYFDVQVSIRDPNPAWYDEVGKSTAAKPLIAGYQVLYAGGTTADPSSEPRTSVAGGTWLPARDPANPSLLHGVIPVGTALASVSIPNTACGSIGCWYWLAVRLVYQDDSMNPTIPVAPGSGPLVVSPVGSHCGPVNLQLVVDPPCMVSPMSEIQELQAVRAGADVALSWQADPIATGYNLWLVRNRADLPDAGADKAPPAEPVPNCALPAPSPTAWCTDSGGVDRERPSILYYKVRSWCEPTRSEGP